LNQHAERSQLHHAAGAFLGAIIRLLPRRRRFQAAMLLARALEPFLRRTVQYRLQDRNGVDGPREIAANLVLRILTRKGLEFDPDIKIRGWEDLARSCREGRSIFLAAPHMALMLFLLRLCHDHGVSMLGVMTERELIYGTRVMASTIAPSPTFLVKVRNHLRRGGFVSAMLDPSEHHPRRTIEVQTDNGRLIVAPAMLKIAAACGAQVVFMEAHVEGLRIAGTIVRAKSDSAEALTCEFAEFVTVHAAVRRGERP
jgi:lauroyl/myristoyl acyltransferase